MQQLAKYLKAIKPMNVKPDIDVIFVHNKRATYTNGYVSVSIQTELPDGIYDKDTLEPAISSMEPEAIDKLVNFVNQKTTTQNTLTIPNNKYLLKGADFIKLKELPGIYFMRHNVNPILKLLKNKEITVKYNPDYLSQPIYIKLPDDVELCIAPVRDSGIPNDNLEEY